MKSNNMDPEKEKKAQSPLEILITVSSVLGVAAYILNNPLFFLISASVCATLLICLAIMRIVTTTIEERFILFFFFGMDALLLVIGCLIDHSIGRGLLLGVSIVGIFTIARDELTKYFLGKFMALYKNMPGYKEYAESILRDGDETEEDGEYKEEEPDFNDGFPYDYVTDLQYIDEWETIHCDENATPEKRVRAMELAFDRACGVNGTLIEDLDAFEKNLGTMKELSKYMESGLWKKDFEADEAGSFSDGIKRGVLSEDGLYNVLSEYDDLRKRMGELSK
ncbi:MAG: DUF4298 domain-containing protein [Bacteroidales bacterium]|nr:DUF4298 domain-containing protein [Bacteroidales bacterium]